MKSRGKNIESSSFYTTRKQRKEKKWDEHEREHGQGKKEKIEKKNWA